MLAEVTNRLKNEKYNIVIDKSVKEFIAKKGIDKNFGARPLRRTIQNLIEDRLAEFILDGELCKNEDKTMYEEDGKIILRWDYIETEQRLWELRQIFVMSLIFYI